MRAKVLPPGTVAEIDDIVEALKDDLGDKLIGLYLHGSAVMDCFNADTSDIDLLGVCDGAMSEAEQRNVARALLSIEGRPNTVEISILNSQNIHPWRHPAPYEFHFSSMHIARFYDMLVSDKFDASGAEDCDLAAHISVCRARGLSLLGPKPADVFDPVPYADYFLSAADDFEWLKSPEVNGVYAVLNACRIMRLALEDGVYSKRECGLWALDQDCVPEKELISQALDAYERGLSIERGAQLDALLDYAGKIIAARASEISAAKE